ncbi:hypothetical protein PR048_013610 [Dryococelus australis]|uniref:Uncharacterized protein n=1 Tax=Dryococelus australis TaxID=614101 RepID=A0ABQ9HTH2_9NEOP|nr:hypothetical protein PR048_013610 [Dryococelus australis]
MLWIFGKCQQIQGIPGWNLYMEKIIATKTFEESRVICMPFVNALPNNCNTILTALSVALDESKKLMHKTCIVTFDQPLYMKARDIVGASDETSDLSKIFIRLERVSTTDALVKQYWLLHGRKWSERKFSASYIPQTLWRRCSLVMHTPELGDTAKLWVQYYRMVSLVKDYIQAERTGNSKLHLECVQNLIPYFHSVGHFPYAKSC